MTGLFVAVEGIDGAGKTTLARTMASAFAGEGREVVPVQRYYSSELTGLWKRLVDAGGVPPLEAAALAAADHALGEATVLGPALSRGAVVLADRTFLSHIVHFSVRGVPRDRLERWFAATTMPDVVLWLDVEPAVALDRVRGPGKPDVWEAGLDLGREPLNETMAAMERGAIDRPTVERAFLEYQSAMRRGFESVLPVDRTVRIDAGAASDAVARDARRALQGTGVAPGGGANGS